MRPPPIADEQHGAFSRAQADPSGDRRHALAHAVRRGDWRRLFPRVYCGVEHGQRRAARWAAALLSAGPDAVLFGRTAAAVHGLDVAPDESEGVEIVHVAMRRGQVRRRRDLHPHRVRLADADVTLRQGLPVTTFERTLLDLCGMLSHVDAATVVAQALQDRRTTTVRLQQVVRRAGRARGARVLRELLVEMVVAPARWFELEVRQALRSSGLPTPAFGVVLRTPDGERRPDAYWEAALLALEALGAAFHWRLDAWESDLERDDALAAIGVQVVRITYRQWKRDPARCLERIERVLRSRWPADVPWPAAA